MPINVATLVPASLKSKNVATEAYVDTSVANIDVSGDISANNDVFAQKLGYANYAAMVNAAISGQTVINGGYLNTLLINAGAINANMINTTGLIAENISADLIAGKTFEGSVINGARINGAVIKASYLDLDGELEVLTNYHITPTMYNANPSLYTDAVYIESDNEWRIPSMSTVREQTKTQTLSSTGATLKSAIRSYNCANVGSNLKCVKARPVVYFNDVVATIALPFTSNQSLLASSSCQIYVSGSLLGTLYFKNSYYVSSGAADENWSTTTYKIQVYFNSSMIYQHSSEASSGFYTNQSAIPPSLNTTVTVNGIVLRIQAISFTAVNFSIDNGEYELTSDFIDTTSGLVEIKNSNQTNNSSIKAYLRSTTFVNNMI